MTDEIERDFAPCPLCRQYGHSIPDDKLGEAARHFETMVCGNPLKSWPTHHAFDEQTRDYAQILVAHARASIRKDDELRDALIAIEQTTFVGLTNEDAGVKQVALESAHDIARSALSSVAGGRER